MWVGLSSLLDGTFPFRGKSPTSGGPIHLGPCSGDIPKVE